MFPSFSSTTIHKLHPRSTPCVFLGHPFSHRGYKCYDLTSRKIIISRYVLFDEASFLFSQSPSSSPQNYQFLDDNIPFVCSKQPIHILPLLGQLLRPAQQITPPLTSSSKQALQLPPAHQKPSQPSLLMGLLIS